MAKLGELYVEITTNNTKFNKGIDDSEKKSTKAFKSIGTASKKAAKIAAASLVAAGVASTKFASDLGESVNAVNVVFGESSDIIKDWGVEASTQAGLSQRAFNESSAVIGTLLKKTGEDLDSVANSTIEITTRSADLASVFNKDLSVATTAVGAALRGETEPIRQFGIDVSAAAVEAEALSSGLVENKKDITESVKVQARYNLIMQQSASLAGDFAKTNDDLANSSRVLKADLENAGAELGEVFLPVAAKVVGKVRDITVKLKEQAPIIKSTLAEAWIKFGGSVQSIITKLGGSFQLFGSTIKTSWITAVNSIQIAFNNLAIAITTNTLGAVSKFLDVAGKLPFVGKKFKEASDSVDGLNDSLVASTEAAKEANQASIDAAKTETEATKEKTKSKLASIEEETNAKLEAIAINREAEDEDLVKTEENILITKQKELELEESRDLARLERVEKERLAAEEEKLIQQQKQDAIIASIGLITGAINNLYQIELNNVESAKNSKIEALNEEVLGEEEYATQVKAIEDKAAIDSWKVQKELYEANKATSTLEAGINTALGITSALASAPPPFNIALGAITAAAGAIQIGAIQSQPAPPRPQLATGAIIPGSARGVDVTVAEGGNDELILGGGSKGEAILNRFADKINSRNGGSGVTNNYYQSMFNTTKPSDLRKFNRINRPFAVAEDQRIGAKA